MTTINTNLQAQQAQNSLSINGRNLQHAMTELATGLRVSSAADDAAGMAIGNRMQSRILSLNQAVRNANDGISMIQTADGAAQALSNMLTRMNELAIQSSNDTNGTTDRTALNSEFIELQAGMSTIITSTSWNGNKVLDGSLSSPVNLQIGASGESSDAMQVTFSDFSSLGALTSSGVGTTANASSALTDIKASQTSILSARTTWGAAMNRLNFAADNSANVSMNMSASRSGLIDTDYAKATADLARAQIIQEAGTAMLSQANQQPVMVLHLLS
ncbi:flagellin [Limnohabitans sp. 2KL-17]|uniref:flagellin N-terminal helical domain-containing protein n=1 Tax=Limnohabitans sp. 2KL-17 TaxID=1100704 RepID=UPI000D390E2E|nr:flagellin [Limnohabitans sp. 2KL-17]PUE57994.1 flagellin [Limnohabitans sp. 2KL-17]